MTNVPDISAMVSQLIEAGCSPEIAADVVARAFVAGHLSSEHRKPPAGIEEPDTRSPAAKRQARYRERLEEKKRNETITGGITSITNATETQRVTDSVTPSLSPPSPPKKVSPYNPLQKITPPSTPISRRAGALDSDFPSDAFAQFWNRYPRREGKQAAHRKFDQVRKSGQVAFAKLIAAVDRYAALARTMDAQFVKQPATWLNAGCWDDELAPRNTGPPRRANGPQGFESLLFDNPEPSHDTAARENFDLDLTADRSD